jgi:hypothetical protein
MRIVTKSELQVFKPTNNCVLLKNVCRPDEIDIGGGKKLYMDTKWSAGNENWIINEVISVPKKLIYGERQVLVPVTVCIDEDTKEPRTETIRARQRVGMPWKTKLEVLPHDIVWVNRLTMKNCHDNGQYLQCGDDKYYIFPYSDIYLKKVGENGIQMLNGYCLVEPIENNKSKELTESAGLEYAAPAVNPNEHLHDLLGIVRWMGDPIETYYDGRDVGEDDLAVSLNDTVVLKWAENRRLGNDFTKLGNKTYIVSRRRNFAAILQPSLF